jgi:xyloglucan galactosyltransferase MUR3
VKLLNASPWFLANHGADHFVLHTINQMMEHYSYFNGCMDLYDLCFNCTKLGIDAYTPELFREIGKRPYMHHRWVSVPFPSDFHASDLVTRPLWTATVSPSRRNVLLAFVGSERVTAAKQQAVRRAIIDVCRKMLPSEQEPDVSPCVTVELASHESHAMLSMQNASLPNNLYERSRLCLTPGGDFPTRKGFFDALLSGCVPVIFQPASALTQWPWHWAAGGGDPAREAQACTVLVPWKTFLADPRRSLEQLVDRARNVTFLSEKRACIARVASAMQYRVPGNARGPPDAVDIVLNRLLQSN